MDGDRSGSLFSGGKVSGGEGEIVGRDVSLTRQEGSSEDSLVCGQRVNVSEGDDICNSEDEHFVKPKPSSNDLSALHYIDKSNVTKTDRAKSLNSGESSKNLSNEKYLGDELDTNWGKQEHSNKTTKWRGNKNREKKKGLCTVCRSEYTHIVCKAKVYYDLTDGKISNFRYKDEHTSNQDIIVGELNYSSNIPYEVDGKTVFKIKIST